MKNTLEKIPENYKNYLNGKKYRIGSLMCYLIEHQKICLLENKEFYLKYKKNKKQIKNFNCLKNDIKIKYDEFENLKCKILKEIKLIKNKLKNQKKLLDLKENSLFFVAVEKNKNNLELYLNENKPETISQYKSKYYNKKLIFYFLDNNKISYLEFDKVRISDHKCGINYNNNQRVYKTINDNLKLGLPKRIIKYNTIFSKGGKGWQFEYLPIGLDIVVNKNKDDILLKNIEEITATFIN